MKNDNLKLQADSAAASGDSKGKVAWRCTVCGYIEYAETLPDDFVCPVCGAPRSAFEKITVD